MHMQVCVVKQIHNNNINITITVLRLVYFFLTSASLILHFPNEESKNKQILISKIFYLLFCLMCRMEPLPTRYPRSNLGIR